MQRYLPQPDLPKVRRIVTGHTVDGRSIFEHDEQITPVSTAGASGGSKSFAAGFSLIHKSCGHPVGLQGGREELAVENLRRSAGDGIVCEVVDFPPGRLNQDVFMHRNSSLDYMVILKGSILAVLDGGAEKTLNEGDILVQRYAHLRLAIWCDHLFHPC